MTRATVVLAIVAAISFAARSFLPDSATITGSGASLAFGFLLLASLQTGHIFHDLKLPHLTGFILCGAIFGPEVLGLITPAMLHDLSLVKKVAVGLIALTAGCELNFQKLKPQIRAIGFISVLGLLLAFVALWSALFAASYKLPFADGMSLSQRAVMALVCSSALCALSPSVVMGILSETRAEGPVSEICLSIVVLADLAIAVVFALIQSIAVPVFSTGATEGGSLLNLLMVHILGSVLVGIIVGLFFAIYIQRVGLRIGLFVFALLFVVAEAGDVLHLDPLLVGLSAGLFLENVSPVSGHKVVAETEIASMPTFAVFFSVIGAEIHLHAFLAVAPFAVVMAFSRALGLFTGARAGARLSNLAPVHAKAIPFGMFPQAGVAIALANVIKKTFPGWGDGASTLVLGTVLINEMAGPVLFRAALVRAGEVGRKSRASLHVEPHSVRPAPLEESA